MQNPVGFGDRSVTGSLEGRMSLDDVTAMRRRLTAWPFAAKLYFPTSKKPRCYRSMARWRARARDYKTAQSVPLIGRSIF